MNMPNDDEIPFELTDGMPQPGEDFEADVAVLLAVLSGYLREQTAEGLSALADAKANVEAWYDEDDPRSMGWVDDKGRP